MTYSYTPLDTKEALEFAAGTCRNRSKAFDKSNKAALAKEAAGYIRDLAEHLDNLVAGVVHQANESWTSDDGAAKFLASVGIEPPQSDFQVTFNVSGRMEQEFLKTLVSETFGEITDDDDIGLSISEVEFVDS